MQCKALSMQAKDVYIVKVIVMEWKGLSFDVPLRAQTTRGKFNKGKGMKGRLECSEVEGKGMIILP